MMRPNLNPYRYLWPQEEISASPEWRSSESGDLLMRTLPERPEDLSRDSRWPAFFPSSMCLVTASGGGHTALEKVVGATIVNRFPYVIATSFCRDELSSRHYARRGFMDTLERGGTLAVQFLPPGSDLDRVMGVIGSVPDDRTHERVAATGLGTRPARTNDCPIFESAYMVYEAQLVSPGRDLEGRAIYEQPWQDVGSHRIYFLEINAIQLREDIAMGRSQVHWTSLPSWSPSRDLAASGGVGGRVAGGDRYQKGFTPYYSFPSANTVAFEADEIVDGYAVKELPPLPEDQVEVDNDRARWPCFYPSSVGMITSWGNDGLPNLMPCGSTSVVSRHPLVIAPCVSYARINVRYAPRASLDFIRDSGRFGCGVPFIDPVVLDGIVYAGNNSFRHDEGKVEHSGLTVRDNGWVPELMELPVHFDCEVVGEVRLGTHIMFLGEVRRIRVRSDLTAANPIQWCGWADVDPRSRAPLVEASEVGSGGGRRLDR